MLMAQKLQNDHGEIMSALDKAYSDRSKMIDVINENGDVHILVKKFNLLLFDLFKKKSAKSLAKMAAEALLNFIEHLKGTGELNS